MILNEENIRTLVILVTIVCGVIWQNNQFDKKMDEKLDKRFNEYDKKMDNKFETIDNKFETIDKRFEAIDKKFDAIDKRFDAIDNRFVSIDKRFEDLDVKMDNKFDSFYKQLKTNDFAHLNNAIGELTFILEKNGFLKTVDREHINSKLDT
jgi:predicted nuclease with TOPRIM domain